MLGRIAVCAAVLALSARAHAQQQWGGAASFQGASGDDSDLSEPTGDDPGEDPVEDIPADLMSDGGDGAPVEPGDAKVSSGAPGDEVAAAAPRRRPAHRDDEAAPESKDAALDRVARDCRAERGLFCDKVLADDLKTARCLLQYRDDVLADCQVALDAALPYLEKR